MKKNSKDKEVLVHGKLRKDRKIEAFTESQKHIPDTRDSQRESMPTPKSAKSEHKTFSEMKTLEDLEKTNSQGCSGQIKECSLI